MARTIKPTEFEIEMPEDVLVSCIDDVKDSSYVIVIHDTPDGTQIRYSKNITYAEAIATLFSTAVGMAVGSE